MRLLAVLSRLALGIIPLTCPILSSTVLAAVLLATVLTLARLAVPTARGAPIPLLATPAVPTGSASVVPAVSPTVAGVVPLLGITPRPAGPRRHAPVGVPDFTPRLDWLPLAGFKTLFRRLTPGGLSVGLSRRRIIAFRSVSVLTSSVVALATVVLVFVGGAVVGTVTMVLAICVVGRIITRRLVRAVTAPAAVRAVVA